MHTRVTITDVADGDVPLTRGRAEPVMQAGEG